MRHDHRPHMMPKVRSKLIMASAAGQPCTYRIASIVGLRCAGPETTVAAHQETPGSGMATKSTDIAVGYCCSVCHDILDGRNQNARQNLFQLGRGAEFYNRQRLALIETWTLMLIDGVIVVPDGEWT